MCWQSLPLVFLTYAFLVFGMAALVNCVATGENTPSALAGQRAGVEQGTI